jgi:threonine synthase
MDGGNLDVILDHKEICKKYQAEDITNRTDGSIWRYLPLLPVSDPGGEGTPLRFVGWTPVYGLPDIGKKHGIKYLWLKDESKNPTASFKDRASAVVIARARDMQALNGQAPVIVTASTGNAGAALAGMSAAVGQKAVIFAPRTAPAAKVAQLLIYGAQVILVDGSYDDAFDLSIQAANYFGWYCRNTGFNPFTLEGKKTAAFEIWEWFENIKQTNNITTRNLSIFVSVGDGNIISGLHKGFKDLQAIGWLEQIPRLIGIQAEGSAAITNAFLDGSEVIKPVSAVTLADSISVDLPRDGVRAVRAARETGGFYLTVKDDDILIAISELGKVGVFAEPAGATAYAGLLEAFRQNLVNREDPIIVINTGSGLKDVTTAMRSVRKAPIIKPTLESVKKIYEQ